MKVNIGIRTLTICLLGLLIFTPNISFSHNIDLPDLGEAASQHMSVSQEKRLGEVIYCLLYTSPSPRDISGSRMPSSA